MTGTFIAFEGGDGAGKSTQLQLLADHLRGQGLQVVETREPGATPLGLRLRALLLEQHLLTADERPCQRAEALLFAADRAQHVQTVIRPALRAGKVVLCDRYIGSSIAYQSAGRGLDQKKIMDVSLWAADELMPDLTILLDIDPGVARERMYRRGGPLNSFDTADRQFAEAVRDCYHRLASTEPTLWSVLDASGELDAVQQKVRRDAATILSVTGNAVAVG